MQPIAGVSRFLEHPLVAPLIALASAGAAKTDHDAWGIGILLGFVSLYFGAAVTAVANRSLARRVDSLRRYETTRAASFCSGCGR